MKKIVIAGGSGFLGRTLERYFRDAGWTVVVLTRKQVGASDVRWDGVSEGEWETELVGAEAIINLCGRSVDCRYTPANRVEILRSRVEPTRLIGEAIRRCPRPPKVWLNASTATIYRHTFGEPHTERGEIGSHPDAKDAFSIEVAEAWEEAWEKCVTPATRKVALRTAMVLGLGKNSVFPTLRRLTRLGLGGRMGSGKQFVSWIHEADFCRAVQWIIEHDQLSGPINVAAPNPLTNTEMMRIFRTRFGMPFGLPATEWMLELGAFLLRTETELILKSRRVVPSALILFGFKFRFPEFAAAIENLAQRR